MDFKDILNAGSNKKYIERVFEDSDKRCKIELFANRDDIGYCKSDILCNDHIRRYHEKGLEYAFLFFNDTLDPLCFKVGQSSFVLNGGEFWIGRVNSEFSGVFEYQNKRYGGQCIFMDKTLSDQIEGVKKFNCKNSMAIKNLKAAPMQILILKELASSKIYGGKMREIFMEAKILEMIYRCFGEARSDERGEFSADEIKILNKARQILLSDLQNPPSIKELARLCATNEFKLKINFKKHFGTTIYALLANERLGVAKELLNQNDISVKEAANMVGYVSAPHFAKIFKAKFGILPNELLKQRNYYEMASSSTSF